MLEAHRVTFSELYTCPGPCSLCSCASSSFKECLGGRKKSIKSIPDVWLMSSCPGPQKKLTVLSSQLHVAILGRSCGTFEKGLQVKKNCCENLLSNFYRSLHRLQSAYPPCLLEHTQATALHLQSGLFLLQPAAHVAHVVRTVQCPWIVPRNVLSILSILSHPTWMPSASASGSCHMLPHLPRCGLDSAHQGPPRGFFLNARVQSV